MCTLRNLGLFRLLDTPGCPGEDLQAQKWSFWMFSVELEHQLPAELPLTVENHWFHHRLSFRSAGIQLGKSVDFVDEKTKISRRWKHLEKSTVPKTCSTGRYRSCPAIFWDDFGFFSKFWLIEAVFFDSIKTRFCTHPLHVEHLKPQNPA